MKVNNSDTSAITITRGAMKLRLIPGVNTVPEYDWLETIINKSSSLEYILDVQVNDKGLVNEEDKVITTSTKRTKTTPKSKGKKKTSGKK